jgi:hypothetical protein
LAGATTVRDRNGAVTDRLTNLATTTLGDAAIAALPHDTAIERADRVTWVATLCVETASRPNDAACDLAARLILAAIAVFDEAALVPRAESCAWLLIAARPVAADIVRADTFARPTAPARDVAALNPFADSEVLATIAALPKAADMDRAARLKRWIPPSRPNAADIPRAASDTLDEIAARPVAAEIDRAERLAMTLNPAFYVAADMPRALIDVAALIAAWPIETAIERAERVTTVGPAAAALSARPTQSRPSDDPFGLKVAAVDPAEV